MEQHTIVTHNREDTTDLKIQQRGQPAPPIVEWQTQVLAGRLRMSFIANLPLNISRVLKERPIIWPNTIGLAEAPSGSLQTEKTAGDLGGDL